MHARERSAWVWYLTVNEAIAVHTRVDHLHGGLAFILSDFHFEEPRDVRRGLQVDLHLCVHATEGQSGSVSVHRLRARANAVACDAYVILQLRGDVLGQGHLRVRRKNLRYLSMGHAIGYTIDTDSAVGAHTALAWKPHPEQ